MHHFKSTIIIILAWLGIIMVGCQQHNTDLSHQPLEISGELSGVDSLYQDFSLSHGPKMIVCANRFFDRLNTEEFTDSLIQFAASASPAYVSANVNYWMGEYLYAEQRMQEALKAAEAALSDSENLKDQQHLVTIINELIGAVYIRLSMYEEAQRSLEYCLELNIAADDKEGMSSNLNNLAALMLTLKQPDKAKPYIDRAIEIEKPLGHDDVLAVRFGIASEVYMKIGQLQEAERFARMAYELDSAAGRTAKMGIRLSQLAAVYMNENEYDKALTALNRAVPMLRESGNKYSTAVCENQLGDIHRDRGELADAAKHYQLALDISQEAGYKFIEQRALLGLWASLRKTDSDRAAECIQKYISLTDSIYTETTQSQIASMQTKFEFTELEFEKEKLAQQQRLLHTIWAAIAIIIALVLILLGWIVYSKYKKNKLLRELYSMRNEFFAQQFMPEVTETVAQADSDGKEAGVQGENAGEDKDSLSQADKKFMQRLIDYINKGISTDDAVTPAGCAGYMHLSPRQFTRKVTTLTGDNPSAYINRIKILRAKRLLDSKADLSISEVAMRCGFDDAAYFAKVFRTIEGITPSQYRNTP